MTTRSLKRFEQLLLDERRRALRDLTGAERELQVNSAAGVTGPEIHDELDVVSDRMAAEVDAAIAERESSELEDIDVALRELYHAPERFGRCELCDRPIGRARLVVLPWARRCVRHGRAQVRGIA